MSERRVMEAADDFRESSYYPGYCYGRIVGTRPSVILLKGYKPGKGELIVTEPDSDPPGHASYHYRIFKIVE